MFKALGMYFTILLFVLIPPVPVLASRGDVSIGASSSATVIDPGEPLMVYLVIDNGLSYSYETTATVLITGLNGQPICDCQRQEIEVPVGMSSQSFQFDTYDWESGAYNIQVLLPVEEGEASRENNHVEMEARVPYHSEVPDSECPDCGEWGEIELPDNPEAPVPSPTLPPEDIPVPEAGDISVSMVPLSSIPNNGAFDVDMNIRNSFSEAQNLDTELRIVEGDTGNPISISRQYQFINAGDTVTAHFPLNAYTFKAGMLYWFFGKVISPTDSNMEDNTANFQAMRPVVVDLSLNDAYIQYDSVNKRFVVSYLIENKGTVPTFAYFTASNGSNDYSWKGYYSIGYIYPGMVDSETSLWIIDNDKWTAIAGVGWMIDPITGNPVYNDIVDANPGDNKKELVIR